MGYPSSDLSRPALRRALERAGAEWQPLGTTSVAVETDAAPDMDTLALFDLSPLPRIGFKGRGTMEAMRRRGVVLEAAPNRAFAQPDGSLCLVLAASEVLLLSSLSGDGSRFDAWMRDYRLEDGEGTYPLLRGDSHVWLALSGRLVPEMLATMSAMDFRLHKFGNGSIAQTSVARMGAIVARWDRGALPLFHLIADAASALYLSDCLLDAGRGLGIGIAGLGLLRERGE